MVGVVIFIDVEKPFALLSVNGHSRPVVAHFRDVQNAKPRRLDYGEIVNCQLVRDGIELRAVDIRILTGIAECLGLARIVRQRDTWGAKNAKRR